MPAFKSSALQGRRHPSPSWPSASSLFHSIIRLKIESSLIMGDDVAVNGKDIDKPCARCSASHASLVVRSDRLCNSCFASFVDTKIVKRLETNRTRGGYHDAKKTLLIPVKFDISSICLLHALDQQLRRKLENGRHTGYTLHILCIDDSCVRVGPDAQVLVPLLKEMFPGYMCSVHTLEECSAYGIDLESLTPQSSNAGLHKEGSDSDRLSELISTLPSATSKVDVVTILRRRLTAAIAKQNTCDSILYSESTTKLAERVLAETANGRGAALSWLTSDNVTTDGIPGNYPLRDLLHKELVLYVDVLFPSLKRLIVAPESERSVVSSKDMTIDGLMSQYFESVEESYPSIVANVVRTTGRLSSSWEMGGGEGCRLCTFPIHGLEHSDGEGVATPFNQLQIGETSKSHQLCFGCARALYPP